mgnify:CR=1 FL=1|tara:strand:+ start:451 stop:717 length:267 start_codon:yes stop_codon:yes gene_type:complete
MSWPTALMVYGILWWLVLFMVLPFGVRTADEAGEETEPGHASSAPVRPRLWVKAAVTTAISAVIFGICYGIVASGLFDLRAFLDPTIR